MCGCDDFADGEAWHLIQSTGGAGAAPVRARTARRFGRRDRIRSARRADRRARSRRRRPHRAADLLHSGAAARAAVEFQQAQRQLRREAERRPEEECAAEERAADGGAAERHAARERAQPNTPQPNAQQKNAARPRPTVGVAPQELYLTEAKARLDAALAADIGFVERLAWFWSNHFCVSADKGGVRPIAGAFEREAIRAHVLGRFGDMLLAVESHPAMLIYLDNARSIGPNSPAGRNRSRGLNENLAREILELHTLGVRSVYTQDDVTNFAKVITGWTVVPPRQDPALGGTFTFNPRMHEAGPKTVIGKRYDAGGVEQGRRVLADLARHPATAQHIATKIRAPFHRRRAVARVDRASAQALPRHRRRSQGARPRR